MLHKFVSNIRGNFLIITALAVVPLMGGLAIAIDFTEMSRQRQVTMQALDAAGIAMGRHLQLGADPDQAKAYATDFFNENVDSEIASATTLSFVLPNQPKGGGILKLSAKLKYKPVFLPLFKYLLNTNGSGQNIDLAFNTKSEIRLRNTIEIALVLDNSGSMRHNGNGSGKKRIDLLKAASKKLVDKLATHGSTLQQVPRPVQFSLVPFSSSVNVGPSNASEDWMDTTGISPIHHENFDWSKMTKDNDRDKWIRHVGNKYQMRGNGWNYVDSNGKTVKRKGKPVTRFTLFEDMKIVASQNRETTYETKRVCKTRRNGSCVKWTWKTVRTVTVTDVEGPYESWAGCVEARPYPYNTNDTPATASNPATLFVPMFAPDEPGNVWREVDMDGDGTAETTLDTRTWDTTSMDYNSYWADSARGLTNRQRLEDMRKYFYTRPYGTSVPAGRGPNFSCTTPPITPLEDVSTVDGKKAIKDAIDAMTPDGATDAGHGLIWGWHTLSSGAPFTEGRSEAEAGNDKIVILLTDGENTYYTPGSLGLPDPAKNKSIYSAHGYTGKGYDGSSTTRLFKGSSSKVSRSKFFNNNYTVAMDEQLTATCENAKKDNIVIITVALDLNKSLDAKALRALENCSSVSRFGKNADGSAKRLFWNTTGANLDTTFDSIADELSNLRIVG